MINRVFQGGGVRGIAYAGALESLPPGLKIRAVAGTSAGAIVAALLATGNDASQIRTVLQQQNILELLYEEDVKRLEMVKALSSRLDPLLKDALETGDLSVWKLFKLRDQIKTLVASSGKFWTDRGMHRSDKLGLWLDRILDGKTFSDATAVQDIQIVAADISRQSYQIYKRALIAVLPSRRPSTPRLVFRFSSDLSTPAPISW